MSFGAKLKELRNEKGYSQEELSQKIDADGKQISRYENGKIMPSADVLVKIAETFNISIDYLLLENKPRLPLHCKNILLLQKLKDISEISEDDQKALLHFIDAIEKKNKIKNIIS